MSALVKHPFHHIIIYSGPGPYSENIEKRVGMFEYLNRFRIKPWQIEKADRDSLINRLQQLKAKNTLLVIPAGQSTHLDEAFSKEQTLFLKNEFFQKGGRGYFNCGSAYWTSEKRIYRDLCTEAPEEKKVQIKSTNLPLFHGVAHGPLCPFPGKKYKVGFFSDAVQVTDGTNQCTIYLSGGGAFILPEKLANGEKVSVLLRYPSSELSRLKVKEEEISQWENAAIMTSIGKGAAMLSMFHPYYGPKDIDPELYEKTFPFSECGTDWNRVHSSLTPLDARMQFVYKTMILPLESKDFTSRF